LYIEAADEADQIDVLQVNDDESILDLSATFLEKNHDLLSIHSKLDTKEALDYDETTGIGCIVPDYDMPSLNGVEFFEQVRETHPDVPFISYTSKRSKEVATTATTAVKRSETGQICAAEATEEIGLIEVQADEAATHVDISTGRWTRSKRSSR